MGLHKSGTARRWSWLCGRERNCEPSTKSANANAHKLCSRGRPSNLSVPEPFQWKRRRGDWSGIAGMDSSTGQSGRKRHHKEDDTCQPSNLSFSSSICTSQHKESYNLRLFMHPYSTVVRPVTAVGGSRVREVGLTPGSGSQEPKHSEADPAPGQPRVDIYLWQSSQEGR